MSERIRAYCQSCRHVQFFRRVGPVHRWHFLLAVLTVGVWLISWLAAIVSSWLQPWRCQRCNWHLPRAVALSARGAKSGGAKNSASDRTTPPTAP